MALINFDANTAPEQNDFSPIEPGEYLAAITESEIKQSKANPANQYLALVFEVIDGKYKGRKIFHNLNLWHDQPVTREISQGQLRGICEAVGVLQVQDSQILHGRPMNIKVGIQPAKDGYEASNNIKHFSAPANGAVVGAPPATPATAPAPAPAPATPAPAAPAPAPAPAAQPATPPPVDPGTAAAPPAAVPPTQTEVASPAPAPAPATPAPAAPVGGPVETPDWAKQ